MAGVAFHGFHPSPTHEGDIDVNNPCINIKILFYQHDEINITPIPRV